MTRREALGSLAAMLLPASSPPPPVEGLTYYHRGFAFDVVEVTDEAVYVRRSKTGVRDAPFYSLSATLDVWQRDMAGAPEGIPFGRVQGRRSSSSCWRSWS